MHPQLQRSNRLPSLPAVAVEILRLFNSPDSSIQEVTETIQTDPALAVKILKAANSQRYGARGEITDLRMGITRLGRNNITPLVLSFSLASTSLETTEAADFYKEQWLRSFVQATAAEIVAAPHGPATAAECFTINLLSGIGRLAMLKADVDLYGQCREKTEESHQSFRQIAEEMYGVSPLNLSVDILDDIGLPDRCIHTIRCLESPEDRKVAESADATLAEVTHTANAVANYLCDDDAALGLLTLEEAMTKAGRSVEDLLDEIHARLDESASLFNVDPAGIPPQDELLESALEQLAEFTSMVGTEQQDQVPSALMAENGRLKKRVQDLIRESSLDSLTGVFNRTWFDCQVAELQAVTRLRKSQFGIAVIDIDFFKKVNDTLGHLAGDAVLHDVAQALNDVTRQNETIARYGGEEFVLLLEESHRDGMMAVGERLRSRIESQQFEFEGKEIPVTISIGMAHGHPTGNDRFKDELFARADAALYEAKHNGRNQVVLDSKLCIDDTAGESRSAPVADQVSTEAT